MDPGPRGPVRPGNEIAEEAAPLCRGSWRTRPCDRNKRADIVEIEVSHALRLPFSAVRAAMEQTRTRFPLLAGAETQLIAVLSLPQHCVAAILPCAKACVKVFRRSL